MSRFFPHTDYAEEQPLYKTILTFHVLHRAFLSGATIGLLYSSARSLIKSQPALTTAARLTPILRGTGIGALVGTGFMAVGLPFYMQGQTEIQWRDRSWRLLEHQGQMETDDWSLGGSVVGAIVATLRSQSPKAGRPLRIVGGAGMGNLAGVLGYCVWRHGIRHGER